MDPQLVNYNGQLINLNGGVLSNKFPIRDGLVIYFDADIDKSYPDSGVDLNNLGVSAHLGELKNGVEFISSGIPHFQFDGTDDYILVPNIGTEFTTSSSTTFNLWCFSYGYNYSQNGVLMGHQKSSWPGYQINANGFVYYSGQTGSNELSKSIHSLYHGGWKMVTFIIDRENNEYRGYLNGVNVPSFTTSATHPPLTLLRSITFGGRDRGSFADILAGNVQLGSFMMYERALTDEEILQTYNESKARLFSPIKTDGLVLHLDAFDNKSVSRADASVWYDLSPSSNDATRNNMSYQSYVIQNEIPSYLFDGVNDYMDLPDFTLSGDSTVELVFNLDSAAGNNTRILGTSVGGSQTNQLAAKIDNDTDFYLWCRLSANAPFSSYGWAQMATISPDEPIFVSFVNDTTTSTIRSYVNGVLDSSKSYQFEFNKMSIGSPFTGIYGSYFRGDIHEVRMYDKVLTADEIAYNFEARRGRYGI